VNRLQHLLRTYCLKALVITTLLGAVPELSLAQFYNGYQMQFGKNRVQFNDRFWSFYRFNNFDIYFYKGGGELAAYTGRVASGEIAQIEKMLDYKLDGRLQFIIYNKLSEAKQSNIGLMTEETSNNIGGYTRIVGNKIFLYFNGDHEQLCRQIRAGISKVLIDQVMYGGDFKDRVQNSAFLYLPEWYENGLLSFLSRDWNAELDNKMLDGVKSGKYLKINRLTGEDAVIVGHSIWKYITDTYGTNAVSNLLYMTRINRNIESGFVYVLGVSLKAMSENWAEAMKNIYQGADENRKLPSEKAIVAKPKPKVLYSQLKPNADGRFVTYVTNDLGRYKIFIYDLEKQKKKRVKKGGFRSYIMQTDGSFPLIAWHPAGKQFAVMRERKGKILLGFYDVEKKKYEESEFFNFDKILDISYSDNGQELLLSGVQKGQSDIFVYNLRSRTYEQVTRDLFDDFNPRFVNKSNGIVFSSNRPNDSVFVDPKKQQLPGSTTDIFYYDFKGRSSVFTRITNTPDYNETYPIPYDSGFAYLSDESGIINRYTATLDSVLSFVDTVEHYRPVVKTIPQTDYARNIVNHELNYNKHILAEILYKNGRYYMYASDLASRDVTGMNPKNTLYRNQSLTREKTTDQEKENKRRPVKITDLIDSSLSDIKLDGVLDVPESESTNPKKDSSDIDIDNYVFQDIFPKSKKKGDKSRTDELPSFSLEKLLTQPIVTDTTPFVLPPQRNYETAFSSDYFVAQLDNSLLNLTYQSFTGGGPYFNSGLNGFIKMGINDLLEDYRITGGFKLSGDLNSNEYLISFENLKHRLDKQITFYRQARFLTSLYEAVKVHTHELRYTNKWPFSDVAAVSGSVAYRNDRFVTLSTESVTLHKPTVYDDWVTALFQFVFDNTLPTGLNLYNGTRFKVFGEYYKQLDRNPSGMYVVGFDIRHYQKIHRSLIWANRFAASASFGHEKIIYYMGATDNWISPDFNYSTPIDYTQNYAYQALATNLRGFDQNIRNGSNFAVINSEIRFPVFTYLLNTPVKSDFLRNFQIVGFADLGTAWNGPTPYDSTNALNNQTISRPPFTVTIISQREPIVAGYGFGLRSRIIGYFLRADWAWGVDDGVVQPHIFYLSLSLDF